MTDTPSDICAVWKRYRDQLAQHGITLPLNMDGDDVGSVRDANGRPAFVVDVNHEQSDVEVELICHHLISAINLCGGFRPDGDEIERDRA